MFFSSLADERLGQLFKEFSDTTVKEMTGVLGVINAENQKKLDQEMNCLQSVIDEKDQGIEKVKSEIDSMRKLKNTRTHRLFTFFSRGYNRKLATIAWKSWKKHHLAKQRRKKMEKYIVEFYRRGIMMRNYKGWKTETKNEHKNNVNQASLKKINSEVSTATQNTNEDAEILRKMVTELTEDLRNETIAKNHLKYKFEQSILRGMSALNLESMNINQDIISQSRSISDSSRSCLYTPSKLAHLFSTH